MRRGDLVPGQHRQEFPPLPALHVGKQPQPRGAVLLKVIPPHQGQALLLGQAEKQLGGEAVVAQVNEDVTTGEHVQEQGVAEKAREEGQVQVRV